MADNNDLSGKIINFLFGTVLAGLVTTGFTYKSWREQTRLAFAKERLAEATKTFDNASQLISERLFRSYDVGKHISDDDLGGFTKRRDKLESAIEDWNLAYADLLKRFQFALEVNDDGTTRPYEEVHTGDFDQHLSCAKALDEQNRPAHADWSSPSWLFAAMNYCFIHVDVGHQLDVLRKEQPSPARNENVAKLDEDLDNLDAHAGRLRSVSKKAIDRMRHSVETQSFWAFLTSW
ncbi:MAG: hypothetical protein ACRECP_10015 [Methylocella sp.]